MKSHNHTDLIEAVLDTRLQDLHTMIPARIVKIDSYEQQKITVQPLIKERDRDYTSEKGLVDKALIQGVPVLFPSGGTGILTFPIKVGDKVMLSFSEESLDNWLYGTSDNPIDPEDFRRHDYNDVIAIAGLYQFKRSLGIHPENVVLRMNSNTGNECSVSLKPNGDVQVISPSKVIVEAASDVVITTQTNMNITVAGNANIDVNGNTVIDCPNVTVNSDVINLNSNVNVDGYIYCTDQIVALGNVTGAGVSLKDHTHNVANVQPGGATKTSTAPN